MGGGLWRDVGQGTPEARNKASKAAEFKRVLKEDTVILADIQAELRRQHDEHDEERDTEHLHASELCKRDWCPRSSWYRITGTEPDPQAPPWNVSVYAEGHDIHDRYQTALWRLGKLEGEFRCLACRHLWWAVSPPACELCFSPFLKYEEVPIYDESIRLLGRADGQVDGRIIEIKTIGLGTIRIEVPALYKEYQSGELTLPQLWGAIKHPFPSHLRQINLYLRAKGFKQCIVLYEFKADQRQKEFVVRYQPHLIEEIVDQAEMVVRSLAEGKVVRRPDWADEAHKTCKKCPYWSTCWRTTRGKDVQDKAVATARPEEAKVRILRRVA